MAHTAIRLGYISTSGGGGGGGIVEYANLAAFPAIGQSSLVYLALDTKKIYKWSSSAYLLISPSEVISVNTKVGVVVLDKTDIGLGNVDNTSDLDKPISSATQTALDDLDERIVPIEERSEVTTVYAYENNTQVFADGEAGIKDPSALIRDGWYFKNAIAGQKINWYYFDGLNQGTCTLGDFKSAYAVMTFDAVSGAASPIIAIYTLPTGTGDVIPGFAHSRIVYDGPMTPTPVVGKQYLVYAGENPPVHPNLPRINLALIPGLSIGDKLPTEQILTVSFGSNSAASVNSVQYMVETLGLFSDPVKHEMDLRIRQASQLDLTNHVTATNNPHSVTKTQLGLENVDNTSDLDKPISSATQTALNAKEDTSNKSIDGTLAANSDTLYPSQKAIKTYIDNSSTSLQNQLDASTYYHELHVNYDYTGTVVDGSPYKPFKTVQAAVNAAQLQNIGGNTAILIHLKNDITMVENITVNNAVSNLYIMPAVRNNTSSAPFKIIGSLTISGSQTNRVRVQDIEFAPTSGYALVINDTPGRHLFENCGFVNGSVAGLAGTGINLTSTYRNFIEFVDCTIEGTLNIAGTPVAGTTVTMYRCKLSYANVIVNSANIAVGMYDTYGIYGITHTAGALGITGMWGFAQTGFFNSTAALSGINFLSLANMSLQKPDLSFIPVNKTGTCFYQFINVHRGEAADVLSGTRFTFGPTSTDSSYKMGVSGNWSPAVSNVAGALDQLAANKISTSQKGVASGVAPLNSSTKIDSTYLPSYVDDVVEYANLAAFPITGETGKIYIALDTNLCYRWSGSVYVEISPAPVISVNGQTNVVVLDSDDLANQQAVPAYWDIADGSTIKAHLDELAARREAQNTVTNEPTGFATRTESTTSFSDSGPDRTFTIAPTGASFEFYVKGIKFTKTSVETIQIPNLAGNHFIYYNASGVLSTTQVASSVLFKENALLSIVYWNTDTNTHSYFAEERHGLTMDGETHSYLHTVFGAQYLSGLALENFVVNGDGSLAAHAQFTADEGTIRDEDLLLTLPAETQIPVLYRQGSLWRKKAADSFPVIYSGTAGYTGASGRLPYNELISGSWQLTQVTNNDFVLVHLFGTNDKETPIIAIQGIAQYGNITAARLAASTEITSLSGLPFAEFVALGSVVFETANAYTNTPKARTRSINGGSYVDFRGTQLYTPAGVATSHGLLSGLSNDDHIQYHTDTRGDIRYYTKAQVDALVSAGGSPGDINEGSYSFSNSQIVPESITGFTFNNAIVRSFKALISVSVDATTDLFEVFELEGIQKGSEWDYSIRTKGDVTGVIFSITNAGQIQYTSSNYTGFISGVIKFRAITTSV